jgi:serine/threonine-protein kinase HipA
MKEASLEVHVDLHGAPLLVGRLHPRTTRSQEGASFEYSPQWLQHPERFALEPGLKLGAAPHHTQAGRALFGALGDSAPDRWGRNLINRAERHRALAEGKAPRALREIDYLLGVSDETRPGALRFRTAAGAPFLADRGAEPVPPLLSLGKLLAASERVESGEETAMDLRLLLAPGSSLGGARPKASVRDPAGRLLIAKFPSPKDEYDVIGWEAVTLALAGKAGLVIPRWRLEPVARRRVLLLERFDRRDQARIPYLSAMSLLGAADREPYSYPEIADALRQHGAGVAEDLPQLWRRMVFNVLVSNTDDHLRNHGVLYDGPRGWRLSPAFDLNPVPADVKPRLLTTTITRDHDPTASLELAFEVAKDFALEPAAARAVAREIGRAVSGWRKAATVLGFKKTHADRMASAFEHEDAQRARAI